MDTTKVWLLGGAVSAGVIGLVAWLLSDDGNSRRTANDHRQLRRDEVINILKDLKRE